MTQMMDTLTGEVFAEFVTLGDVQVPLADRFHPDYLARLVPYDPDLVPAVSPPSLDDIKATLAAAATAKRWEVETGGATLPDGTPVLTGSGDQARLTSVLANAANAEITHVDFKSTGPTGEVVWQRDVPVDFVKQVARAVALHVQACFSAECRHHEVIANLGTLEAAQSYDVNVGWPAAPSPV